ncbi:gephyrin-like [Diadema setosum]|uniref:gephyrin-like n=1 Tax=Diadema setosum TaxID=31175 RepID=UPI003B3B79A1
MAAAASERVRVGVLTVSDRCSKQEAVDKSGPNLKTLVEDSDGLGGEVVSLKIVPDEISRIKETLIAWTDDDNLDLILTTGGTGFADRDVTPEATKAVLEKEAPGLAMTMLMGSLKVTPLAALSRAMCGIRKRTLIINLPGSVKGSQECYGFALPTLRHAIQLLKGEKAGVAATHKELATTGPLMITRIQAAQRRKKKKKKHKHTCEPQPSENSDTQRSGIRTRHGMEAWDRVRSRDILRETSGVDVSKSFKHIVQKASKQTPKGNQDHWKETTTEKETNNGKDVEVEIEENDVQNTTDTDDGGGADDDDDDDIASSASHNPVDIENIMSHLENIDDSDSSVCDNVGQNVSKADICEDRAYVSGKHDGDKDYGTSPGNEACDEENDTDVDDADVCNSSNEEADSPKATDLRVAARRLSPITTIDMSALREDNGKSQSASQKTERKKGDLGVFQFDPEDTNESPPVKSKRVIVLSRPFGTRKQRKVIKKTSAKKGKSNAETHRIQAGKPLMRFLRTHPLLKDITLSRGKRSVKRNLVMRRRGDESVDTGIWKRMERIQERNRVDDLFDPTEEGQKLQELIRKNKRRNEYVVAWYLWCPGHGNCLRRCGSYGRCSEGCQGAAHKQDRHNCSVVVHLKLFLGDLDHWSVKINGHHVAPDSQVVWTPPPPDKVRHDVDMRDLIVSQREKGESLQDIHKRLMEDPLLARITPSKRRMTNLLYNSKHLKTKRICNDRQKEQKVEPVQGDWQYHCFACPPKQYPHHHHDHHHCQKIVHHDVEKVARRPRDSIYPVIPFKDALKIVMENTPVLPAEEVDLKDALGRIVSEEIKAPISLPPFRNSIKDGYAVIASDGPGVRKVISDTIAGDVPDCDLIPGHVIRITTGAPIPKGADAVVQVEDTELVEEADDGRKEVAIRILSTPKCGQDIRPVGSDLQEGTVLLIPGTKLGPPELGLLASVGITKMQCYRKPLVGVCSTGNELTEPWEKLPPGHIYDSNRTSMLAILKEMDMPTVDMGIAPDTVEATKDLLLRAASKSDVIVTTGGVSMGEKDLLKYVLSEELKANLFFGRIFLKPGKPTTFCTFEHEGSTKLFFSLPGNPVSGIVTFNHFVLPCLRKMMGYENPHLRRIKVRIESDIELDPRPEFQRVLLDWSTDDGVPRATTTGNQISSRLISLRQANALLALPSRTDEVPMLPKGSLVEAVVLRI